MASILFLLYPSAVNVMGSCVFWIDIVVIVFIQVLSFLALCCIAEISQLVTLLPYLTVLLV